MATTRRAIFQFSIFGYSASWLTAAEVWEKKSAAEWTDKDIEKLMNKSPWAKRAVVDTGRGPAAFSGAGPTGGGRGGGRAPSGPQGGGGDFEEAPGGGGPAGGGGGPIGGSTPEALVRWESALPVLEAQKRALPDAFKGSYAISVTGFPIGGPRPGGGGVPKGGSEFNLEAMRAAQAQTFEHAKQTTWLERKGKDPIAPSVMGMTGRSLVIVFPRGTQPIALDDKEVTLVLKVGLPEMKAKFSLKEMVYMGKLEL